MSVLGWLQVIERSSPADLGWSADHPAPEDALTAVAVARGLAIPVALAAEVPVLRQSGPFPHPPGRRLAAFIVAGAEVARASVDPDLEGVRLLGTVRSAELLAAAVTDARQDRQPRGQAGS